MSDASGGIRGASPYLLYQDAGAALEWMTKVAGLVEVERWVDEGGEVREAEVRAGDTTIGIAGCGPELWADHGLDEPFGHGTIVHVDDVDAHHERAVAAGGRVSGAPEDAPYGVRTYTLIDPEGHQWYVWQRAFDPPDELGDLHRLRP